jgi:hypothetical protein
MTKIRFYDDTPKVVLPELERFLNHLNHLVPDWCSHVWVAWRSGDSDNASTVADIMVHYDYRWACLNIYASWLEQTEEFKHEALVHELIHLFVAPLSDYAHDMVKLLVPADEAEKFNKATVEQVRERCESVTQDLTRLILEGKSDRGVSPSNKQPYAADGEVAKTCLQTDR